MGISTSIEISRFIKLFKSNQNGVYISDCFIILDLYGATKNKFSFDDVAFSIMATLYVGMGFYYFIETREAGGIVYIFYSLFIIWATDSGAYFIGRALGNNKLSPEISPNKTIEGFIGGICCAVIVAMLFGIFTEMKYLYFGWYSSPFSCPFLAK